MAANESKKKLSLTTWILVSLVAGIVVGLVFSAVVPIDSPFDLYVIEGIFYVLGQWFIRLMQMLVIPLVFCSDRAALRLRRPTWKLPGEVGQHDVLYLLTTAIAKHSLGLPEVVGTGWS